jgi:hypothetical protein
VVDVFVGAQHCRALLSGTRVPIISVENPRINIAILSAAI